MIRAVVVVVLMGVLAAAALVGQRWLAGGQNARVGDAGVATCYPLQQPCRWQTPDGEASVVMSHRDGDELAMTVTLPGGKSRVMVLLSGESMYMGEYPLRLETAAEPDQFQVQFVPPFCTTGDEMIWKVDLRVAGEPVTMPFRLLFSPH